MIPTIVRNKSIDGSSNPRRSIPNYNIKIVSVVLGPPAAGRIKAHPTFEVLVHDQDSDHQWKVSHPFASFRDQIYHYFEQNKDLLSEINSTFPRTFHKSALGFQLGPRQLEERRDQLEKWLTEVVNKMALWPATVQNELLLFLHVDKYLQTRQVIENDDIKSRRSLDRKLNEVVPTLIGTLDTIQSSHFWTSYRESQNYSLSIHIYEASLNLESGFKIVSDEGDLYVLIYGMKDKEGTKQMTSVQKKSEKPVWNETVVLQGISCDDRIKVEIKGSKTPPNGRALLDGEFVLENIIELSQEPYIALRITGDKMSGVILLGFDFDPTILIPEQINPNPTLHTIFNFESFDVPLPSPQPFRSSSRNSKRAIARISEILKIQDPVYYSIDSSLACFMMDADFVKIDQN